MKIKFDKTPFIELTKEEKELENIRVLIVKDKVLKDLERLRKKELDNNLSQTKGDRRWAKIVILTRYSIYTKILL